VPTFNDAKDRVALNTLGKIIPGREVVGIHCRDLVLGLGTLLLHDAAGAGEWRLVTRSASSGQAGERRREKSLTQRSLRRVKRLRRGGDGCGIWDDALQQRVVIVEWQRG